MVLFLLLHVRAQVLEEGPDGRLEFSIGGLETLELVELLLDLGKCDANRVLSETYLIMGDSTS